MIRTGFQRLALAAFIAVEVVIFAGAVVRATGSGLGCPDWPFCYGRWIPPSRAEEIDFSRIDLGKFRAKAARLGRDPGSITPESLRAAFDPLATWVEYLNRLVTVPAGVAVLALFAASFSQLRRGRPAAFAAAATALALVLLNAWLGARVVLSGLRPGVVTLHMILGVLLLCVLVFAAWRGTDAPWRLPPRQGLAGRWLPVMRGLTLALLILVVVEGILGSQVRELTDRLALSHPGAPRREWVSELEASRVYLIHRSFSWLVFGACLGLAFTLRGAGTRPHWTEWGVILLVVAQMILGLVLARIGVVRLAQILHIGISSLLVSCLLLWLLGARRKDVRDGSGTRAALG